MRQSLQPTLPTVPEEARHPYLKASLLMFLGIIVILLTACAGSQGIKPGVYPLYTSITVQEDLCIMPDRELVNGLIRYNTIVRSVSTICVSLKSDDPERTLRHELDHAARNAMGLDAKARNE